MYVWVRSAVGASRETTMIPSKRTSKTAKIIRVDFSTQNILSLAQFAALLPPLFCRLSEFPTPPAQFVFCCASVRACVSVLSLIHRPLVALRVTAAKPTTDRWDVAQDDDGNVYYVNRESGESVWERPDDFQEWVEVSVGVRFCPRV